MSKIWIVMILSSLIMISIFSSSIAIGTMMDAAKTGVTMSIEFIGIYAVWMGFMQIMDDCGISKKISNALRKPVDYVFGRTDEETRKNICLNISSNILGLGSAATPYGLKAMQGLDKGQIKASRAMIMLVVINSTGIQLLPTTVIGMRALSGSVSPSCVLWPTIVSTFVPTLIGIVLVALFYRRKKNG